MGKKITTVTRLKIRGDLLPANTEVDVVKYQLTQEQLVKLHRSGAIKVTDGPDEEAEAASASPETENPAKVEEVKVDQTPKTDETKTEGAKPVKATASTSTQKDTSGKGNAS